LSLLPVRALVASFMRPLAFVQAPRQRSSRRPCGLPTVSSFLRNACYHVLYLRLALNFPAERRSVHDSAVRHTGGLGSRFKGVRSEAARTVRRALRDDFLPRRLKYSSGGVIDRRLGGHPPFFRPPDTAQDNQRSLRWFLTNISSTIWQRYPTARFRGSSQILPEKTAKAVGQVLEIG